MPPPKLLVDGVIRVTQNPRNIRNICVSGYSNKGDLMDCIIYLKRYFQETENLVFYTVCFQDGLPPPILNTISESIVHDFQGQEFLINLIDNGYVDFVGNISGSMRTIDGTVVLISAVEGIVPQIMPVILQFLRERVRPILCIDEVDHLIKELKFSEKQIFKRIRSLVDEFNHLLENIAEPQFKGAWKVSIEGGSVAFGSVREKWALSIPYTQKKKITLGEIIDIYSSMKFGPKMENALFQKAPLYEVLSEMIVVHLPNPIEAQKYRIQKMWQGDIKSKLGQDLLSCNPEGKLVFAISKIMVDPKSGKDISAGRLFSGTIRGGQEVWLNNAKQKQRIQDVYLFIGMQLEIIESLPAGNIFAVSGVVGAAGETVTLEPEHPFE